MIRSPMWRSLLYVPVNVERYVAKAHTRGADCILLDLEDSVPVAEKDHARTLVARAAARVRAAGADVAVRINQPLSLAVRDVEASVGPDVDALALTKVEGASHVRLLDALVTELEGRAGVERGRTGFIVMIETPAAYFDMARIAAASERVVAMNIGGEDFALACGMEPTEEALFHPKQEMIFAARAAGISPLGYIGTVADFGNEQRFRDMVRRSRRLGFDGASCVHPAQVRILNEEYSPRPGELAYAERVLRESAAAAEAGRGSFSIDGRMIDAPIVERARRLLEHARALDARRHRASMGSSEDSARE